jgi:hypothetical protein
MRILLKARGFGEKYVESPPAAFSAKDEQVHLEVYLSILSSVSPSLKSIVRKNGTNAKLAWNALEERFKENMEIRVLELKQSLGEMRLDVKKGMSSYFANMRDIHEQIVSLGGTCSEFEVIHIALRNLPKEYENVKDNILDKPSITIVQAEMTLVRKEKEVKSTHVKESETAMAGFVQRKKFFKPSNSKDLPKRYKGNVCWHCNDPNHKRADCEQYKADLAALQGGAQAENARARVMGGVAVEMRPQPRVAFADMRPQRREVADYGY